VPTWLISIPPSLRLVLGASLVALCLVAWPLSLWLTSLPDCYPHPHSPLPFVLTLPPPNSHAFLPPLGSLPSFISYTHPISPNTTTHNPPVRPHPHSSHSQRQPLPSFFPQFSPNTISMAPRNLTHPLSHPIHIVRTQLSGTRMPSHTHLARHAPLAWGKWQSPSSLHQGFNEPRFDHRPPASLITLSVKT